MICQIKKHLHYFITNLLHLVFHLLKISVKIQISQRRNTLSLPKRANGLLTSHKLSKAHKENLCFNCLGQHARKDCPQLHSNDLVTNKGKEKVVHMVQLLPLETSTKYLVVRASHQTEVHECFLIATPWHLTFGPHELF